MNDTAWLILVGVVLFYLFTKNKEKPVTTVPAEAPAPHTPTMAEEMARVRAAADGGYFGADGIDD